MKLTRRKFISLLGAVSVRALAGRCKIFAKSNLKVNKLTITYPPTIAALPLAKGVQKSDFLSDHGGHFREYGIDAHLRAAQSSSEAVRLVSGGIADCCITDLSSAIYGITGTGNALITSTIFNPNEALQYYGLLTSKYSHIATLDDLITNRLDKSEPNSIVLATRRDVQYATDKLLAAKGYSIDTESFYLDREELISRMTGLLQGNYISAVLPEPLVTLATKNPLFSDYQANLLDNYNDVTLPPFVLVFRQNILDESPSVAKSFHKGWMDSVRATNESNKLQLLGLSLKIISRTNPQIGKVIENMEFTEDFANLFDVPTFNNPETLDNEIYQSVIDWALSHKFLQRGTDYKSVIDSSLDLSS